MHRRRPRRISGRRHLLRQSEIEDLDPTVPGDEEVRRFQIAMDDAFPVRRREPGGDLYREVERLLRRKGSFPDPIGERLTIEELRHEIIDSLVAADVVNGEYVGVVEPPCRLGFVAESLEALGIPIELRRENLEGDVSIQTLISSEIDFTHPTGADRRHDLETAELCSLGQRHGWRSLTHAVASGFERTAFSTRARRLVGFSSLPTIAEVRAITTSAISPTKRPNTGPAANNAGTLSGWSLFEDPLYWISFFAPLRPCAFAFTPIR